MFVFRPSRTSEQPEDVLRAGLLQNHQLLLVGTQAAAPLRTPAASVEVEQPQGKGVAAAHHQAVGT